MTALSELDRLHRGEYGGPDGSCPICAAEQPRGHATGCPFHPAFELPKVSYSPAVHFEPITLTLPFPLSVNHYWDHVVRRRKVGAGKGDRLRCPKCSHIIVSQTKRYVQPMLSDRAKEYRADVERIVKEYGVPNLRGRLDVHVRYCRKDRTKYDIDNYPKGLLDAMQHAGVYENDGQIDELHGSRGPVEKPGWVVVTIRPVVAGGVQGELFQ